MAMTMSEVKTLANDLCKRGMSLDQIENLRTYYLDARKAEQEAKRKAEAELQKSRAIRISTNYERGKTTLIFFTRLCVIMHLSCRRMSCTDLIEQIVAAYMDTKDGASTSPEDFDALIAKLSKLL